MKNLTGIVFITTLLLLSACQPNLDALLSNSSNSESEQKFETESPTLLRAVPESILSVVVRIDGLDKEFVGSRSSEGLWSVPLDIKLDESYSFTASWYADHIGTTLLILEQSGDFFADSTMPSSQPNTTDVWSGDPKFDADCDGYENLRELEASWGDPLSLPGCSPVGVWVGKTEFGDDVDYIIDNSDAHGVMVIDETNYVYSISETTSSNTAQPKAEAVFGPLDSTLERFRHFPLSTNSIVHGTDIFGWNFNRGNRFTEYNLTVSSGRRIENEGVDGFEMYWYQESEENFTSPQEYISAISMEDMVGTFTSIIENRCGSEDGSNCSRYLVSITTEADGSFTGYRIRPDDNYLLEEYSGTIKASTASDRFLLVSYSEKDARAGVVDEDGFSRKGVLYKDNKYPGTITLLATGRSEAANVSVMTRLTRN